MDRHTELKQIVEGEVEAKRISVKQGSKLLAALTATLVTQIGGLSSSSTELLLETLSVLAERAPPPPPRPPPPVERFKALLPDVKWDTNIAVGALRRLQLESPTALAVCADSEVAKILYERAKSAPGKSTKERVYHNELGLCLDGVFSPPNHAGAMLLYAYRRRAPFVLKIPDPIDQPKDAEREVHVWEVTHNKDKDHHHFLAGPMKLVRLSALDKPPKFGVLLPYYNGTMAQWPTPISYEDALDVGRELLDAITHLHSCKIAHCDVKESNVFLTATGECRLGDFGSATALTEEAKTFTRLYVPPDLVTGGKVVASERLDKCGLASTLLSLLGKMPVLGSERLYGMTIAEMQAAAESVPDAHLQELLLQLIKA